MLVDGRSVGVAEYGDPSGPAVFYCHGWPACRVEAGLIDDLPVRLIAADRPGYGQSSPLPGRTLLDGVGDAVAIADHLGLPRFFVAGMSGGGPFAAALAAALPDRVAGLALINPVPPAGVPALNLLGRHPALGRVAVGTGRWLVRSGRIGMRMLLLPGLTAADRACMWPDTMEALRQAWCEALQQGTGGAVADAVALARPWGFALEAVRVPTTIWSGADDTVIPSGSAAAYAAIPGARQEVVAGEGHYSLPLRHVGRILRALTA